MIDPAVRPAILTAFTNNDESWTVEYSFRISGLRRSLGELSWSRDLAGAKRLMWSITCPDPRCGIAAQTVRGCRFMASYRTQRGSTTKQVLQVRGTDVRPCGAHEKASQGAGSGFLRRPASLRS